VYAGEGAQEGRQGYAAGGVEFGLRGARIEEAHELARIGVGEGEFREVSLDALPRGHGEDEEAGVQPAGDDHAAVHEVAEGGGDDDSSLVVDAVLVLTERHRQPCSCGSMGTPSMRSERDP